LTLNVLPVNVEPAVVQASILPFESSDQLRDLWDKHRETHFFRRRRAEIIAIPVSTTGRQLGGTTCPIDVSRESGFAADLVRRAIIEHLVGIKRMVLEDRPIEFLGSENLLKRWCGEAVKLPDWMQIKELWEVSVRVVWLETDMPVVTAAFGVRLKKFVEASCAEILAAGIRVEGMYVAVREPHKNRRCLPFRRLVGRVESVGSNGVIRLADYREGFSEVSAASVFPEASWGVFDRLIEHYGGNAAASVRGILDVRMPELRHGPTKLNRIVDITNYFRRQTLQLLDNCRCSFGELLSQGQPGFPRIAKTHPPVYVFDPNGRKTDTWHDRGLDINGPYHSSHFPKSSPRVVVICQASKKGRVEQAIHKLLNGITVPGLDARGKRQPFAKGLIRKYLLRDVKVEFETTDSPTFADYDKAARRALEKATPQSPIHLALVQIDEQFHQLPAHANPYLATKSVFLSNQVPVQEFEYETIAQADAQLAYTFNNMALATYAKLGGVPWLLKADPAMAHELVVGLGSASISESRLGDQERVVGITTLFSGDGQYYLANVSKSVPFQDYPAEMLASIRASLEQARKAMNWQDGDLIRLVFHAFKPLKDDEARTLAKMMNSLGNYQADYAFLHLVEHHPYQLFDEAQQGEWFAPTKSVKGVYAPERGRYIQLSRNEAVLTMTGPRDVKQPIDGLPRPLLLRLHRESTFTDMPYLANQVSRFALHSWRSFFPSPLPVTMQYSDLIARLLGLLAKLPKWNPDVLLGQIRESRWFL
jgi:hypothetical protein